MISKILIVSTLVAVVYAHYPFPPAVSSVHIIRPEQRHSIVHNPCDKPVQVHHSVPNTYLPPPVPKAQPKPKQVVASVTHHVHHVPVPVPSKPKVHVVPVYVTPKVHVVPIYVTPKVEQTTPPHVEVKHVIHEIKPAPIVYETPKIYTSTPTSTTKGHSSHEDDS